VKHLSLGFIAFLQALGIILYCSLISVFFANGNRWFGPNPPPTFAPVLFLSLLAVSVVTCGLIFLAYPFILFWDHKQTKTALKLIVYSTIWLAAFVLSGFTILAILH
jgi:hypothetical protein